jgi:polygalacturonase
VSGTKPQYAIDLEPNANDTIDHVLIENVEVVNCEGGFLATKAKKSTETKKIGDVKIRNCKVSALSKYSIKMTSCESLLVENCTITAKDKKLAIYTRLSRSVVVRNNTIHVL